MPVMFCFRNAVSEDPLTSAIGYSNGNHELVSNVLEVSIRQLLFDSG